jgi:hypothetical protein
MREEPKTLQKPRLTTEQVIQAIEKYNGMVTLAARFLGVSRWAIYKRAQKNPAIKRSISMSREELVDIAESKLRTALNAGEPWAIQLALKTIGKNRGYVERNEWTGLDGDEIKQQVTFVLAKNPRDDVKFIAPPEPKELEDGD